MDEISASTKTDPLGEVETSPTNGSSPSKSAAEAAKWENRSSPKRTVLKPIAAGRGIACAYEGDNGCRLIADVEVDLESGKVKPKEFTVAVDCGPISNPDGLRNQTEGGILQGMSRALMEEVTWDDKQVTSMIGKPTTAFISDSKYQIDIVLMSRTGVLATGAGKYHHHCCRSNRNAIFDATGVRLRSAIHCRAHEIGLCDENS
jgi:CO/xanthine dehydrogenase Mo-binding subunit